MAKGISMKVTTIDIDNREYAWMYCGKKMRKGKKKGHKSFSAKDILRFGKNLSHAPLTV